MLFKMLPKRAVVIAPHADDDILGAGGFIAGAQRHGWEIHALFITVSGYLSEARGDRSITDNRLAEVKKVASLLNFASYKVLFTGEEMHLRLDTVPQAELIAFVSRAIEVIQPSIAVIPHRGHYHQDHRAVADACIAALRPAPDALRHFVPVVIAYGHAVSGWGGDAYTFKPNFFVDITHDIETKLAAIACYESQLCEPPHPRSLSAIRANCAAWGAFAGVTYAEPFECVRFIAS